MSISWRRGAAFSPAAPVPASGPTATRLLQLTSALRLSGCISAIPRGSEMGNGKTSPRPSPSSIGVVGLAAVAPISSALDLEAYRVRTTRNQAPPLTPLFSMPTLQSAYLCKPVRATIGASTQASRQIEATPGHRCRDRRAVSRKAQAHVGAHFWLPA